MLLLPAASLIHNDPLSLTYNPSLEGLTIQQVAMADDQHRGVTSSHQGRVYCDKF